MNPTLGARVSKAGPVPAALLNALPGATPDFATGSGTGSTAVSKAVLPTNKPLSAPWTCSNEQTDSEWESPHKVDPLGSCLATTAIVVGNSILQQQL